MKKLLIMAMVLAPALALAEPKTPDQWYEYGVKQYDLGNFDPAIDAFKKGFELETNASKRPAYLYNIAQAYRQAKNCKDAVFFYKRYLALRDDDRTKPLSDKKRAEIDKIIEDLEACVKEQDALAKKPPEGAPEDRPPPPPPKPVAAVTPEPPDDGGITKTAPEAPPHVISLRLLGGGAKITAGSISPSIQPSVGLLGGYPVAIGDKLTLELGGAVLLQPVPAFASMGGSATMISVLADVGATFSVASHVGIRGDLGVGALVLSGASESDFTDGKATTGALAMLAVRAGASVDIAITPNLLVTLMPIAFSYSPPKAGLRDDIKSITRLDFMIGVGYRM